jgi:hypothetical protein
VHDCGINSVHDGSTDGVPAGVLMARGAGLGAAFGGLLGLFIAPVADLVAFREQPFDVGTFFLGIFTGPVGVLYGLITGLTVGFVVAMLPVERRTVTTVRWIAATVGPATVAMIGWFLFRPTLHVGPNQSRDHVIETLVVAYFYPCASAFLVAVVGAPRLVAPARLDDTPSWR